MAESRRERVFLWRASIWVFVFVCYHFRCRGFLDFARNDNVSVWLAAVRGRPALPRQCCARQRSVVLKRYTLERTRNAPTYSINHYFCHFKTSFRPKLAKRRNPPRLSPDDITVRSFSTFKALRGPGHSRKCPSDFLVLFLRLKKNIFSLLNYFHKKTKNLLFVSFAKKRFVTIKVCHSGSAYLPARAPRP